jgi:hypothetical protein
MVTYKCKTIAESQEIYRRKYEVDKELDPVKVEELAVEY